jgi:hypothetical protein
VALYGEWDPDLQAIWDSMPGTSYLTQFEQDYAELQFDVGFRYSGMQYDALSINPDMVTNARENFFSFMRMNDDQFPWAEWRLLHPNS